MSDFTPVTTRVDFSGPFFTRDPGKTLRGNVRDLMEALAAEMESDVRAQITGHAGDMPYSTGWTYQHTIGRTESYNGKRWAATAVVSANTAGMSAEDAIRTKAAAATIERRWHPYRKTARSVRSSRALLRANLTEGLE